MQVFYNKAVRRWVLIILLAALVISGAWWFFTKPVSAPGPDNKIESQPASFDSSRYSLTDPNSLWVVVNKKNRLPSDYRPNDLKVPDVRLRLAAGAEQMRLRVEAGEALKAMFAAAKGDGHELLLGSGWRSYALQKSFYDSYVAKDGQAAADRYSARPGHSEHQTGLGVDIARLDQKCHLEVCFGDLPEGQWLAAHAHEYGFLLRYTADKEPVTGYQFEPWHFRYIGKELAAEMHTQGITTLEEFFNLPSAPTY